MANSWSPDNTWRPTTGRDGKFFKNPPREASLIVANCNEVSSVTIQNHIPGQEINVALNPMYFKPIERPKITSTYTLDRCTSEICFCAIHNPNWGHTVHITAGNSSFQEIGHEISAGRKQENYVLRNNTQPWSLGDACSSQVKKSDLDPHSQGVLGHMYDVQQRQPLKLELKNRYRKIATCTCKNK